MRGKSQGDRRDHLGNYAGGEVGAPEWKPFQSWHRETGLGHPESRVGEGRIKENKGRKSSVLFLFSVLNYLILCAFLSQLFQCLNSLSFPWPHVPN